MTDVIDSLKRVERVGSENSKTTEKLIKAASEVADRIVSQFANGGEDVVLETQYVLETTDEEGRSVTHIKLRTEFAGYCIRAGRLRFGDRNSDEDYVAQNRANALRFSKDIANGLLDVIAEIIERRNAETAEALAGIEAATRKQ
jgi:hypothetical protein